MFGEKRFEEGQAFAAFVYPLILAGIGAMLLPPRHWQLISVPMALMFCALNLLYMRTHVEGRTIRVQFGLLFPLYVRTIETTKVESAEAVTYSPIAEYGGWGIRGMGSRVALNARGNRGVLVRLTGGRTVLIGSQRPQELVDAIQYSLSNAASAR